MGELFRLSSQPDVSLTRKFKMTETAAAKAPKAPKKAAAKAPKTKPAHPPTSVMIVNAVTALKERNGSSLPAIKKYITANYKADTVKLAPFIKKGLKNLVEKKVLIQTKGKGASGSFKVSKVEKKEKKPANPKQRSLLLRKPKLQVKRRQNPLRRKQPNPKVLRRRLPRKLSLQSRRPKSRQPKNQPLLRKRLQRRRQPRRSNLYRISFISKFVL